MTTPNVTISFQIGTSTYVLKNNSPLSFSILAPCSILSLNIKHLMIKLHFHNCLKFFEHHLPLGKTGRKNSKKKASVLWGADDLHSWELYPQKHSKNFYHNIITCIKGSFNFIQSLYVYRFNTLYYPNWNQKLELVYTERKLPRKWCILYFSFYQSKKEIISRMIFYFTEVKST